MTATQHASNASQFHASQAYQRANKAPRAERKRATASACRLQIRQRASHARTASGLLLCCSPSTPCYLTHRLLDAQHQRSDEEVALDGRVVGVLVDQHVAVPAHRREADEGGVGALGSHLLLVLMIQIEVNYGKNHLFILTHLVLVLLPVATAESTGTLAANALGPGQGRFGLDGFLLGEVDHLVGRANSSRAVQVLSF